MCGSDAVGDRKRPRGDPVMQQLNALRGEGCRARVRAGLGGALALGALKNSRAWAYTPVSD
jgi:hypothetical protein